VEIIEGLAIYWEDEMSAKHELGPIPMFALGVAVGTALGLLFAQQSGEELREDLSNTVENGVGRIAAKGQGWARQAQDTIDEVKDRIQGATEAGKRAYKEELRSNSD
jgi:gas vesicle protein